jgi:hypothetical protein
MEVVRINDTEAHIRVLLADLQAPRISLPLLWLIVFFELGTIRAQPAALYKSPFPVFWYSFINSFHMDGSAGMVTDLRNNPHTVYVYINTLNSFVKLRFKTVKWLFKK